MRAPLILLCLGAALFVSATFARAQQLPGESADTGRDAADQMATGSEPADEGGEKAVQEDAEPESNAELVLSIIDTGVGLLTLAVACAGFWGVVRQLRKSAHSDIYTMGVAIKEALLSHPELRPHFYGDVPVDSLSQEQLQRALVLADMHCLYMEQIAINAGDLAGEKGAWLAFVGEMHESSPIIRDVAKSRRYASDLHKAIRDYYAEKPTSTESKPASGDQEKDDPQG